MQQYLCQNVATGLRYVALSMFEDVLGRGYAKPIYIEKGPGSSGLEQACEQRILRGVKFYSLIKNRSHTYRLNAEIYRDAHNVLKLDFEQDPSLAFNLLRVPPDEVLETFTPRQSFVRARDSRGLVAEAAEEIVRGAAVPETCLGLIGSIGLDPSVKSRDLDVVFIGDSQELDLAYNWIVRARRKQPLQRALETPKILLCSFYESEPCVYTHLRSLRVQDCALNSFDLIIDDALKPTFLNIQIYRAHLGKAGEETTLIIRDTLSRAMVPIGGHLKIMGYSSTLNGRHAILVTDVEAQIPEIAFHDGGRRCDTRNGSIRYQFPKRRKLNV